MKKPLVIITGPTAAGKTDISLRLAKNIGGEIISADSMQVYRGMDIGTAKIMKDQMMGIPHHLIDIMAPSEPFNVMVFRKLAMEAADDILSRGRIPVVVGGTGFYIQALLYDVEFSDQNAGGQYRTRLQDLCRDKGQEYLHDMLKSCDPEYAAGVHANNVKRVIRALEFYHETGQKLSDHNRQMREKTSPWNFACFVLYHDREVLYDRINRRDLTSMQGIGYKEFFDYLDGTSTLEETADRIKKNTRHFAKRQMTWFRREKETIPVRKEDYRDEDAILEYMMKILEDKKIVL